jgi:hypothetical protein
LRTFEKRQEETIGMIKREACASINISNEERKFLRTRVDQLRLTLEKEKKESLTNKHTLETDLHKTKGRLQILEKELKESRFREHSTHQIKEKMISEVALYKRKLTEATLTLQQAIEAKTCLKKEYQFTFKKLKNKIKEVEQNHQHTKSEMAMVQEDYAAIFRTRQQILTKNKTLQKEQDLLRQHQQQEIQQREEIIKVKKKLL